MPPRKVNARDLIVQVSDGAATPTWLGIRGLKSLKLNPGENEETTETTDVDSGGAYEGQVMQRGATLAVEGAQMVDPVTGAPDPGQGRVEALGGETAEESLGQIRFRHPSATHWKVWTATVSLGEQGGETNDKSAWSATFTRSGKATLLAVIP